MKLTKFQIEDDKIFQGFSDGSTWNGWSNPYFTLEVAKEVLNYYQNQPCLESREQWLEWKLEVDKQFMGIDLYCFGFGYCWSEVTKEELERIDLINKVIDNCKKDDEYLRDKDTEKKFQVPKNYFPNDDPKQDPINRWRSHAHLLYGNWINEIYQTTPFEIEKIGLK